MRGDCSRCEVDRAGQQSPPHSAASRGNRYPESLARSPRQRPCCGRQSGTGSCTEICLGEFRAALPCRLAYDRATCCGAVRLADTTRRSGWNANRASVVGRVVCYGVTIRPALPFEPVLERKRLPYGRTTSTQSPAQKPVFETAPLPDPAPLQCGAGAARGARAEQRRLAAVAGCGHRWRGPSRALAAQPAGGRRRLRRPRRGLPRRIGAGDRCEPGGVGQAPPARLDRALGGRDRRVAARPDREDHAGDRGTRRRRPECDGRPRGQSARPRLACSRAQAGSPQIRPAGRGRLQRAARRDGNDGTG